MAKDEDRIIIQREFITHAIQTVEKDGRRWIQVGGEYEDDEDLFGPADETCPGCWGEGRPFGDPPAPENIEFNLWGFSGRCAPCNGHYIGWQDHTNPCIYIFNDYKNARGSWWMHEIYTLFHAELQTGGDPCYMRSGDVLCATESEFEGCHMRVSW